MSDMAPLPASTDTGISQNQGNGQNTIQGNSIAGSVKSALGLSNKPVTDEAESSEATFVDFLQGILQPQTTAAETTPLVNSGNALPLPGQLPTQAASSGQPLQALTDAADLLPGQVATDEALLTAVHSAVAQSSPLSAESISKSIAVSLNSPAGLKAESTAAANRLPAAAATTNTSAVDMTDLQIESLPQLRPSSASAVPLMELTASRQGMDATLPTGTTMSDSISASLLRSPLPHTSMSTESAFQLSTPTITENFGRPDWNQGLGRQIMWMVNQNMQSAEIRLNPAHLGPIEVRIEMDDEKVNVAFSSRHAAVREAVEMALPRLREMFESSGISLADANISQHTFAEQREQQLREEGINNMHMGSSHVTEDGSPQPDTDTRQTRNASSMIDYYI